MRLSVLILITFSFNSMLSAQGLSLQIVPDRPLEGNGSLKVCQGTEVLLEAVVDYSTSSGSNATSIFQWSVAGIAYTPSTNSPLRMVSFDYPSGSIIQVTVTEPISGQSATASLSIESLGLPDLSAFFAENPTSIPSGETLEVMATTEMGQPGYVAPFQGLFLTEGIEQTVTFLPDGSGSSYETSIEISSAPDGAMIGEEYGLNSIWASLEHSYLGDLDILVTCPSGNYITVQSQSGGSCNLGEPWATSAVDGQSGNISQGNGYIYKWISESMSNLSEGCTDGGTFLSGDGPETYTDSYVPAGNYGAWDDLSGLDGCPINGEWIMTITDNIGADNGYLFAWGLEIEDLEFANEGSYSESIADIQWMDDPEMLSNSGGAMSAQPTELGQKIFNLVLTDQHGCIFNVDYPVEVTFPLSIGEDPMDNNYSIQQISDLLLISSKKGINSTFVLLDSSGKQVDSGTFRGSVQTSMKARGLYVLHLYDEHGADFSRRFVLD